MSAAARIGAVVACLSAAAGLTAAEHAAAARAQPPSALSPPEPAAPPPAQSPLDACAPGEGAAWSQEQLMCLYSSGRRLGLLEEARDRLQRLGAGQAGHPWPTLVLGYTVQEEDERRALNLYEVAASGFARSGDAEGEVLARHNLRNIYHRRGDATAAAAQVSQAVRAAEASGLPMPIARAAVLDASHALQTGGDVGRVYRTLQRAQQFAFPNGPIGLRRTILLNLSNASSYLGRLDEAIEALERHRDLQQEDGSTVDAATVAFNLFTARLTRGEQRPSAAVREQLTKQASEVLGQVQQLGRPALAALSHRVLADLLRTSDPDAAAAHLERCLELEVSLGHPALRAACLWTSSLLDASRDPVSAERSSRAALDALAANPNGPVLVAAWQARLRLAWQTMTEQDAMAASLQALDAIERLRARQQDEDGRAALFSNWTRDYYWLSGRLLEAREPRIGDAFAVGERLRARVLLERLAGAGVPGGEDAEERNRQAAARRLRQPIVDLQRRLLDPVLGGNERHALLDQLRLLEIEQRELTSGDAFDIARPVPFASLATVQAALSAGEALLWYSVAPWTDLYGDFGGGAWLVSVTRDVVRVHRLPDAGDLGNRVSALVGLLADRNTPVDRWEPAAERLGRTLVGQALAELPAAVNRLVIVSDGELHRLPFEVLRPEPRLPRLAERFDVTVVPSATLWLRLRNLPAIPADFQALVLADPDLPQGDPLGEFRLAPLPWARREARAIARTLQLDAGNIHEGASASEQLLKAAPLARYAVLHLAAHARADDAFPERSAVFLTPGSAGEDGWLQPAEIAALELGGRLVVLSACESGSGFLLAGEGPLSLARAFFAAGARGVVATRWPLRDDDAAFVMDRFYRALASGTGAAAALRRVRHEAIEAGLPAAAWAGLVLLGDGVGPVLAAPIQPLPPAWPSALLVSGTTLVLIALALALRRQRRRSTSTTAG